MADANRQFLTSDAIKLELLPKPFFEKHHSEIQFYNEHFDTAAASEPFSAALWAEAFTLAKKHGLAATDSLHIAAAIRLGAKEFITSESPGKPIFRVQGIKVISLQTLSFDC